MSYDNAEGKMNPDVITTYQEIRTIFKIPIETKANKQTNQHPSVDVKEELVKLRKDLREQIKGMNDERLQTFLDNYFDWKLLERLNISKVVPELLPRPIKINVLNSKKVMDY